MSSICVYVSATRGTLPHARAHLVGCKLVGKGSAWCCRLELRPPCTLITDPVCRHNANQQHTISTASGSMKCCMSCRPTHACAALAACAVYSYIASYCCS
jgi:hypothetical protein